MRTIKGQGVALSLAMLSIASVSGCASVQTFADTALANRCATNFTGSLAGYVPGLDGMLEQVSPSSPICQAPTQESRLLLTTVMLDRAALSAAKGVDSAQEALGIKRTLQSSIIELERELGGLGTGGSDLTQTVIVESAAGADDIKAQLNSLMASDALNDEALAKLATARDELNNVAYYAGSASAGIYMVSKYLKDSSVGGEQKVTGMVNAGLVDQNFVSNIVGAPDDMISALKDSVTLGSTISKVTQGVESPKAGETPAEEQARADLEAVQTKLAGFSLTQTPT